MVERNDGINYSGSGSHEDGRLAVLIGHLVPREEILSQFHHIGWFSLPGAKFAPAAAAESN